MSSLREHRKATADLSTPIAAATFAQDDNCFAVVSEGPANRTFCIPRSQRRDPFDFAQGRLSTPRIKTYSWGPGSGAPGDNPTEIGSDD
jgi:hypothetical protein